MTKKLINSINETHARSEEENFGVSTNLIRQAVKSGALKSIRAGNRYLINWNHYLEFINNPTPIQEVPPERGVIRRIG